MQQGRRWRDDRRATREENKEQRRTTAIFIHPHLQGQSWATQKIGSPSVPFHCSSLSPLKSHTHRQEPCSNCVQGRLSYCRPLAAYPGLKPKALGFHFTTRRRKQMKTDIFKSIHCWLRSCSGGSSLPRSQSDDRRGFSQDSDHGVPGLGYRNAT